MKHLCLVSDQQMPNFLPAICDETRPEEVTLVVSAKMKAKAGYLRAALEKRQIKVAKDIDIGDDTSNMANVQNILMPWLDKHMDYTLNVTGGTKPMAIAAQEVFRMADRPLFYVDISTDKLVWLDKDKESQNLAKAPTIQEWFKLDGVNLVSDDKSVPGEYWRGMYNSFVENQARWGEEIGRLNWIASECENNSTLAYSDEIKLSGEMLEALAVNGLIESSNPKKFRFASEKARYFCNGGWLEDYLYEKVKAIIGDRQRVLKNCEVLDKDKNKNELDVVAISRNTCYLFECKTKNLGHNRNDEYKAEEVVYKISNLSKNFGLRAKGVIVTYRNLPYHTKSRCETYGIKVIDDLKETEARLKGILRV